MKKVQAAAASYLPYSPTSPSLRSTPPVKVFIADHSFLYVLADKKGSFPGPSPGFCQGGGGRTYKNCVQNFSQEKPQELN